MSADAPAATAPPPKRATTTTDAGPSRRPSAAPVYTHRRTSLYGTEDRIVIDPGSRVWKVGFSGEPDPRAAFWAAADPEFGTARTGALEMWDMDLGAVAGARGNRVEARRLVAARIDRRVRDVYHKHLLTDGKARRVIVVEGTFMPTYVKEELARVLFENLKVPSVAFTPASVLTLAACGHITGLVVDCGWLETTVTPVYCSRPLYHLARSTPLGGRAVYERLRALLRHRGKYRLPGRAAAEGVSDAVLTDKIVERVLSEGCFVAQSRPSSTPSAQQDQLAKSESESDDVEMLEDVDEEALVALLAESYSSSSAKDWNIVIPTERIASCPTLIVPGWIRERAAEVLFGDGQDEAPSLPEVVLETLLKVPVDLRHALAAAVVVSGGMSSLPGMITRLRSDVLRQLPQTVPESPSNLKEWKDRVRNKYAPIAGLSHTFAVLNDPAPMDGVTSGKGGHAPRWSGPLLPWVGGSLAGALKTSGPEMLREEYDTRVTESLARGEAFAAAVKEERGDAAPPTDGIALDDLCPGMAVGALAQQRKRGWTPSGALGDWTTGKVCASG